MEWVCFICKRAVIFWNNLFLNYFPLLECTDNTLPPLAMTWSMKAAATTGADFHMIGTAVKYFEKIWMLVRQSFSLLMPAGKGPIKSTQTVSPTYPLVLMNLLEGLAGLAWNLFLQHCWHVDT